MFKVGTYSSCKRLPEEALQELLTGFDNEFPHYRPKAAILYSSWSHDAAQLTELLLGISAAFPGIVLVGCTASAGFTSEKYIKEGYFLSLFISDSIEMKVGLVQDLAHLQSSQSSAAAIEQEVNSIVLPETQLAIAFSSYAKINCEQVIAEMQVALGAECALFGAVSSDFWSESQMACFVDQELPVDRMLQFCVRDGEVEVLEDALVFLTLSGALHYDVRIAAGWQEASHRFALQTEGHRVVTIQGEEACRFLREWQHPLVQDNQTSLHFSFFIHEEGREPYQRDLFYDVVAGEIHSAGELLPEGALISFSDADAEILRHDYREALHTIEDDYALAITMACVSRVAIMADKIDLEAAIQGVTFYNTPVIAGYFFGEIAPKESQREGSQLLSCSSVTLCLREDRRGREEPQRAYREKVSGVIQQLEKQVMELERKCQLSRDGDYSFIEDALGLILANPKFNKNSAELGRYLERIFRKHYQGEKAPYGIGLQTLRNKLSEKKNKAEKSFVGSLGELDGGGEP